MSLLERKLNQRIDDLMEKAENAEKKIKICTTVEAVIRYRKEANSLMKKAEELAIKLEEVKSRS